VRREESQIDDLPYHQNGMEIESWKRLKREAAWPLWANYVMVIGKQPAVVSVTTHDQAIELYKPQEYNYCIRPVNGSSVATYLSSFSEITDLIRL
jgi:hypothetical protein